MGNFSHLFEDEEEPDWTAAETSAPETTPAVPTVVEKPVDIDRETDLSAAMEALTKRGRRFVELHTLGTMSAAECARQAGYGKGGTSSAEVLASIATRLLRDDRIQAALAETIKRDIRSITPTALRAVKEILSDTFHKDRAKISLAVLNRIDPEQQNIRVDGTVQHIHRADRDRDELKDYRRMKLEMGMTEEKLVEWWGFTGQMRLEQQLAAENKNVVEAEFTELETPDGEKPQ